MVDTAWTQQGIVDLKHLSNKIRKHECSMSPIRNAVNLSLLDKVNIACQPNEGHRISVQRHNELFNKKQAFTVKDCGLY